MRLILGFIVCFGLVLPACQTENSNTLDAATYGGASGSSAVASIFSQHCTPCHAFQSMSTNDLVAAGYMVKGDPTNSPLYYRLIGSSGSLGPKDMPQNGGALATSDLNAIQDYIQNAN